jgi:SAM-dependent methyltransferase
MCDSDAERIIGIYQRHALAFDRERLKILFEKVWLDRFLEHVPEASEIIDIGCGSGEPIAAYLIAQGRRVTGVDSSPPMIEMCRTRFPEQTWIVADMRGLALERRFAGVLAFDSFFFLTPEDQRAMFATFASLAAAGAPLMFTSGPRAGIAMGTFHGEPLYHASLDPDEYRTLLDRNGFDTMAFVPEDPQCDRHSVWLALKR